MPGAQCLAAQRRQRGIQRRRTLLCREDRIVRSRARAIGLLGQFGLFMRELRQSLVDRKGFGQRRGIDGADDDITPVSLARAYVDQITAPHKAFCLIPDAGHMALLTRSDLFLNFLQTNVRPLALKP